MAAENWEVEMDIVSNLVNSGDFSSWCDAMTAFRYHDTRYLKWPSRTMTRIWARVHHRRGCGATLAPTGRRRRISRATFVARVEEVGVRISLGGYHRYRAKMVGVSGGFGKGMFWCDFTLDLPKISAKEPFNPPLLPFPRLHPSITNPLLVAAVSSASPTLASSLRS